MLNENENRIQNTKVQIQIQSVHTKVQKTEMVCLLYQSKQTVIHHKFLPHPEILIDIIGFSSCRVFGFILGFIELGVPAASLASEGRRFADGVCLIGGA